MMKSHNGHDCGAHPPVQRPAPDGRALDRAARLFRALGDAPRLRLLHLLLAGEACVSELVGASGEKFPTVSQRLRVLRTEGLVARRRDGSHVYYGLADAHVRDLVANALAHAGELEVSAPTPPDRGPDVSHTHANHTHQHGPSCGHTAVSHDGHTDYLHDGHLHHAEANGTVTEHTLGVGGANPAACTPAHDCGSHAKGHVHGAGCGHEAVPHGDHVDYLVDGHLHHPHGDHCDDHGPVTVVKA